MCGSARPVSTPSIKPCVKTKIDYRVVIVRGYGTAVSVSGFNDPGFLTHALMVLVGVNNHRQFVIFVTTLVLGIGLFDYLSYACTSLLRPLSEPRLTLHAQTSQRSRSHQIRLTYPLRACSLPRCVTSSPTTPSYSSLSSGPRFSSRGR